MEVMKIAKTPPRVLKVNNEIAKLINAENMLDKKALYSHLYITGFRIGEILQTKLNDFEFHDKEGYLIYKFRREKQGKRKRYCPECNNSVLKKDYIHGGKWYCKRCGKYWNEEESYIKTKNITLPIVEDSIRIKYGIRFLKYLLEYIILRRSLYTKNEWDFQLLYPYSIRWVEKRIEKICKQNNILHIYPHMFRHTKATIFKKNGADVLDLQAHFGWKSIAMASRYTSITKEQMKRLSELNE